jgi:NADPH-dependent 2,4-dienoyl-CoA reductase/sulfur reductase-like enzyme
VRVVIAGAGLAGLRTAETLRERGFDGSIAMVGAELHPPYSRPALSKELLSGRWQVHDTWLRRPAGSFDGLDVDVLLGRRAASLEAGSRSVILDGGDHLAYDALVIATGSSALRVPRIPDAGNVHLLRTLDDCLRLRDAFDRRPHVTVLGAGFIGSEVASVARARGLEVTLVDRAAAPLTHVLGDEVATRCTALHSDNGVALHFGVEVAGVDCSAEGVRRLHLSDGATIDTDVLIVGVGVRAATGWLEGSGVAMDNGVICDAQCRTTVPGVYAVGDVARCHNPLFDDHLRVEHWTNASEQGTLAAEAILGSEADASRGVVPYFWSDQHGVKLQMVGHAAGHDAVRVIPDESHEDRAVVLYRRWGRVVAAVGFSKPRLVMRLKLLIAARTEWDAAVAAALA